LSESAVLEDINTCFNPLEITEKYATFVLGEDVLSEHSWGFETNWILERFSTDTAFCKDFSEAEYGCTDPITKRNFAYVIPYITATNSANSRHTAITSSYETNPYWSEHKHPERPWGDGGYVGRLETPGRSSL
jgi:hypothetical protein